MTGWVSLSWKMMRSGRLRRSKSERQHLVEEVAQRARDEEVLLLEAQLLALRRRVLRVEDLGDVLRERLRADGLRVVAGVEDLQVERPRRAGAPQPQGVDAAVLEARDHVVVGDAEDAPARHPARALDAVVVVLLGVAAEVDGHGRLRVRELPRRPEGQPVVGLLHLPAVDERLAEDPVLVADAVADAGHVHRRERVDEARREPAEATVAEAGLDLRLTQLRQVDAEGRQALLDDLVEVRGEQRVVQLPAQEELRRQVRDRLRLDLVLPAQRGQPADHQVVAHGARHGEVLVVHRGARQVGALTEVQLPQELPDEALDGVLGGGDGGRCSFRHPRHGSGLV